MTLTPNQPLLYVNRNDGDRIYLPTELCHSASLPENFTKDAFKMRDLQKYRITSAEKRKEKIIKLISKFINDEVLEVFGFNVEHNMADIKGKRLNLP